MNKLTLSRSNDQVYRVVSDHKVIPLVDQRAASRVPVIPAHTPAPGGTLADTRGRLLRDLRISVTDRCNFRCTYCMPKAVFDRDYHFLPRTELLSFEEIKRMARLFAHAARPAAYEIDAINEKGERVPTPVAGEHPLTLYLDKREVVALILQKINCMFSAPPRQMLQATVACQTTG